MAGFFIKAVGQGWKSNDQIKQETVEQTKQKAAAQKEQAAQELKKMEAQLTEILEQRRSDANEVIKKMAQADPFLAGEAISKIVTTKMVKQSLEKLTGLQLDGLGMNEWRHNTPLREAVTRQIELMHPDDFKQVQMAFDGPIKYLKQQIGELTQLVR